MFDTCKSESHFSSANYVRASTYIDDVLMWIELCKLKTN